MGLFNEVVKGFVNGFVAGVSANGSVTQSPRGVAAIEQLCRELGWSVDERVGDHGIVLHFRDPLVNIRKVLVTCGESVASVSPFSAAPLSSNRVPQEVLGYLLIRNNELTTAAWRVSAADDGNASSRRASRSGPSPADWPKCSDVSRECQTVEVARTGATTSQSQRKGATNGRKEFR
jgi:hypothetical protein